MKQIANVEVARLRAMANMLDTVETKSFDLGYWVHELPRKPTSLLFGLIQTDPGCGFAGCAMGWAAYTGLFPDLKVTHTHLSYHVATNGKIFKDWEAVETLLGLNDGMVRYLFGAWSYKTSATPEDVADRIRRLISKIETIRARDRRRQATAKPELVLVASQG